MTLESNSKWIWHIHTKVIKTRPFSHNIAQQYLTLFLYTYYRLILCVSNKKWWPNRNIQLVPSSQPFVVDSFKLFNSIKYFSIKQFSQCFNVQWTVLKLINKRFILCDEWLLKQWTFKKCLQKSPRTTRKRKKRKKNLTKLSFAMIVI